VAVLQALRDGREGVRRLARQHLAGHVPAQALGIVEHRLQDGALLVAHEIVEGDVEGARRRVVEGRDDADQVGVAGDVDGRVLQMPGVAGELVLPLF
jgi:hypothetical protein